MSLLITNIGRIYTPDINQGYGAVIELQNNHLYIAEGRIRGIFSFHDPLPAADKTIDAKGQTLLPGFVDAHTHPVFWLTREDEFIMRVQGKSYEEIAAAGGGFATASADFGRPVKKILRK